MVYSLTLFQNQFYRCVTAGAVFLLAPLLYIKYYQTDLQLASDHLGKYCVIMSIIGYGAPLISLVSSVQDCGSISLHRKFTSKAQIGLF